MSAKQPVALTGTSTLTKQERFWLAIPIFHQVFLHTRRYSLIAGTGCLLFGLAVALACLGYVQLAVFPVVAVVALGTILTALFFIPCRCGRQPVLTAKGRSNFHRFTPLTSLFVAAGGVGIGLTLFIAAYAVSGALAQAITAFLFMLVGTVCLSVGLTGHTEKALGKTVVSEQEHTRAKALAGSNEDELRELIDYHLKTGNLEQADALSKRLLSMAEQQQ